MQFWGSVAVAAKGLDIRDQHRTSRMRLLAMTFEDFEREVRPVPARSLRGGHGG